MLCIVFSIINVFASSFKGLQLDTKWGAHLSTSIIGCVKIDGTYICMLRLIVLTFRYERKESHILMLRTLFNLKCGMENLRALLEDVK